jgi:signal transduction histidine kinase/ActR/RegA family two-component response regulator/PAS domain-containing protein
VALQALRHIARALADPLSPEQVAGVVVEKVQERLAPTATAVYLIDASTAEAVLLRAHGFSAEAEARLARVPLTRDVPLMIAMRTGETIWCETREALVERFPLIAETTFPREALRATFVTPFMIDHHVVGGLALGFAAEHRLDALQREVLATIADLAAHAIDRHRLEQRFRRMHDATPDGVAITRPVRDEQGIIRDFEYLYVNPVVARAMKRPADALVGRTLLECLPGLDRTEFWAAFCRVATSGKPETYDHPYNENGWSGWYRNTVVSLGDEIAVTYSDITEQKNAQQTRELLAEASDVLGSSLDYDRTLATVARLAVPRLADWATVDMVEPNGHLKRLAVAHVDPEKVSLGYEVTKRFPIDMDAPRGLANVIRTGQSEWVPEITDDLLESSIHDPELLAIIRDLGLRSTICVPLKARGRVVGAMSLFSAESARRYTEEDVRLVEDLGRRASVAIENAILYRAADEANEAKDEFLAIVSHELRTPLNAILGWVKMLRDGLAEEKRARALETIERNARAQAQLIEDLLDVSRIVSGKLRLDVEPVDLPLVIERAVETVRPAAAAKNIDIRLVLDPKASPVLGDPERLQQVIWNLLSNAVKFSPKGRDVLVILRKRDSSVDVVIEDNGQGIEPSFLPHVFERFRQADPSTTRTKTGLGLGLAIVRNLIELHGGTVTAESEGVGRGATFCVCLPISPVRAPSFTRPPALQLAASGPKIECPPELAGIHVLVVDDEEDARDLVAELLVQCQVKVSTAASVPEALRIVEAERPTVIVSDIGMPEEDGYSLIRKLRALPPSKGGNIPAVALTAYARTEDRTKTLVAGFNMHIPKPVEATELLAVLASLTAVLRGS